MVVHWKRAEGVGARTSMLVNGLGALATGLTVCVVIVAKFTEGAWITGAGYPRADGTDVGGAKAL
jgi:hypothetical protein